MKEEGSGAPSPQQGISNRQRKFWELGVTRSCPPSSLLRDREEGQGPLRSQPACRPVQRPGVWCHLTNAASSLLVAELQRESLDQEGSTGQQKEPGVGLWGHADAESEKPGFAPPSAPIKCKCGQILCPILTCLLTH